MPDPSPSTIRASLIAAGLLKPVTDVASTQHVALAEPTLRIAGARRFTWNELTDQRHISDR